MRSVRAAVVAAALLVACAASLLDAPPAAAAAGADQFQDRAVVTYQLVPARHTVHVTVKLTMANKKPSLYSNKKCTGWAFDPYYGWYSYSTTCTWKTSYYWDSYWYWVEADATHLTVKANTGTVKAKLGAKDRNWRKVTFSFSPLNFGQTRTLTYSYDLPASGVRGTTDRRSSAVIASFCASGPGTDSGEVRLVLPAGYQLDPVGGLKQVSSNGSTWMWSSGYLKAKPWDWYHCINGTNPLGLSATPASTADGTVAKIVAWKDDPVWTTAASTAVTADVPKLAAVLGQHPDGGGLTLNESITNTPFNSYLPTTKVLTMAGDATTVAEFDDAIASTWLPATTFGTGWLKGGYLRWAEATAGVAGVACTKPGPAPSTAAANLGLWRGSYIGQAKDVLADAVYQQNAACWIVSQVADAIGPDRMRATMDTIRSGGAGWSSDKRANQMIRWQDWLDLVSVQGLLPPGKDPGLVDGLLVQFGIAPSADDLTARDKAIAGYLALKETTAGKVPASILPSIAAWDFAAATTAIDTANRAWTTAASVPSALPGVAVDGGPVQKAVQAAQTQADLDTAASLADAQVALAKKVAAAIALESVPRDTVAQVGLAGTTLPSDKPAIDAVTTMDAATASSTADGITAAINGAHDIGMTRIEIAAGSLAGALVLLLVASFLLRRRRRRHAAPALVAALGAPTAPTAPLAPATTPPPAPEDTTPVGQGATPGDPGDEAPPPPPAWG